MGQLRILKLAKRNSSLYSFIIFNYYLSSFFIVRCHNNKDIYLFYGVDRGNSMILTLDAPSLASGHGPYDIDRIYFCLTTKISRNWEVLTKQNKTDF